MNTAAKAIIRGRIPTLENLATRMAIPERLALASSRIIRKDNKVIAATTPIIVVSPRVAMTVTVVTVVTVVIIILIPRELAS